MKEKEYRVLSGSLILISENGKIVEKPVMREQGDK